MGETNKRTVTYEFVPEGERGFRDGRGSLYSEMTNKGRSSVRYVRGAKPVYCFRWVAEIQINGKRHRMRSTNYDNCRRWLEDMIEKAGAVKVTRTVRTKATTKTDIQ